MKWRKTLALALAGAVLLGCMCSCQGGEEPSSQAPESSQVTLENDGAAHDVTLGELDRGEARTAALREIAQKYMADFPNTSIEVRTFENEEALEQALRAGELDILEATDESFPAYMKAGLLFDFADYLDVWDENVTFSSPANLTLRAAGPDRAYLILNSYTQDIFYYRSDWLEAYNSTVPEDDRASLARITSWDQITGGKNEEKTIIGAAERIGEKGRLAFSGKESLCTLYDTILWSAVTRNLLIHPSCGCLTSAVNHTTIFTLENAQAGTQRFLRVMELALPGSLDWTQDEAVDAFVKGEAAFLIADRSAMERLEQELPEGSWEAVSPPRDAAAEVLEMKNYSGWAVSASAGEQEAALHFFTYLCDGDSSTHLAKVSGELPAYREAQDLEPSLTESRLAVEMEMIRHPEQYQYAFRPQLYEANTDWDAIEGSALRRLISGELTEEELLAQFDDYWSQALEDEGVLWTDEEGIMDPES